MYKFWCNYRLLITLVVISLCGTSVSLKTPRTVFVKKCCRIGEQMNADRKCSVGATEKWWPHIHLLQKNVLFKPPGDAPRFFRIIEQKSPECDRPEIFAGEKRMALFSNGSLFLSERNALIELDNYCIDKDIAMVCFPQMQGADSLTAPRTLIKVKKCCGQRSVYDTDVKVNNCVILNDTHELYGKKLIMNSTAIDFLYGFPHCEITNQVAISGRFQEENLDYSTGSLTLDSGRQIQSKEYCLEHTVNDMNSPYASVFTCADHLASEPDTILLPKEVISFYTLLFYMIRFIAL